MDSKQIKKNSHGYNLTLTSARYLRPVPCPKCGGNVFHKANYACVACQRVRQLRRMVRNKTSTRVNRAIKNEVIRHYGSRCKCCKEKERMFLTIDHMDKPAEWINGRRETSNHVYRRLRREGFPKGYQVLCYNCNCGRHLNGGICPHHNK